MAKQSKWNVFVGIAILILLAVILEEAITTNKLTASISKKEQEAAIKIATDFLKDDLKNVPEYKVFVSKTGKYFYPEQGVRKKVVEVIISYDDKSITTLVDLKDNTVVKVSRAEHFDWMKGME